MNTLLSDPKYVAENYRTEDLLHFDRQIEDVLKKTEEAPDVALFGIVGKYGTGKSVMLEQLKAKLPKESRWVHFDAWQYPERNNLWEGFVLDFVKQVEPDKFKQVLKQMEGKDKDASKALIKTFGTAANMVLPGSKAAIDQLTYFVDSSPATRVFQIQDIFTKILSKINEDIYIVAEDADRSGDAGIFFVETLSLFLKTIEHKNKIKVYIPISDESFKSERASYFKALDYVIHFRVKPGDLSLFIDKIFNKQILDDDLKKHHITELLQRLFNNFGLTVRDVKFIIRNSESVYKAFKSKGKHPDPRVVLILEAASYCEENISGEQLNVREKINLDKTTYPGSQFDHLLKAVGDNQNIETMAQLINQATDNDNIYRRNIRFIDKEDVVNGHTLSIIPFEYEGYFNLPMFYLD